MRIHFNRRNPMQAREYRLDAAFEPPGAKPLNYWQTATAATEFRLMVECCRWAYAGGDGSAVQALGRQVDWELFVHMVRRHRVQGLAWHSLAGLQTTVPEPAASALRQDAGRIAAQNLKAAAACMQLSERFAVARLELMFVKGLTLAALAYPSPFIKMSWDLDILIAPEEVGPAAALLGELGYRPVLPTTEIEAWHRRRKESQWQSPDGAFLELHSRLADNAEMIPGIDVRSARQSVQVLPGCTLPTLAAEPLFAYLCVHGASSNWFRLKWISDVAALVDRFDDAKIARLYQFSQDAGAHRAAAQALLLARRVFGTASGSPLVEELGRDRKNRMLANAAHAELGRLREPTEARLGTAMIHLTQLLLKQGIGFKLGEIGRQLADAASNRR